MKKVFFQSSLTGLILILLSCTLYAGCGRYDTTVPTPAMVDLPLSCVTVGQVPFFCGVYLETKVEVPVEVIVTEIVNKTVIEEKIVEVEVEKIVRQVETEYIEREVDIEGIVSSVLAKLPAGSTNDTPRSDIEAHVRSVIAERAAANSGG